MLNARLLFSATPHQILHDQARGYMHAAFFRDKYASLVLLEAVVSRASMRLYMTPQRSNVAVVSLWSVTFCFEFGTHAVMSAVGAALILNRILREMSTHKLQGRFTNKLCTTTATAYST
jgi:hypothetical protein